MKVLLAEDSRSMRELLSQQLRRWGYDVTDVEDGEAAWNAFRESGEFKLVVTDWVMPKVDGLELTRRIRRETEHKYVYIILLTARSEQENLVEAMEAGADDFLSKPCNSKELKVRLRAGVRIINLEQRLLQKNQKLLETQTALVESEKLAGVGQLAAGMAHEINNPIAFVSNNLAVLEREFRPLLETLASYNACLPLLESIDQQLAEKLRREAQDIDIEWLKTESATLFDSSRKGIKRIQDIVSNLREFANLDEAELDAMDVASAMTATLQVLSPEFERRQLTVNSNFDDNLVIQAKPARIKLVFHNLLLNAVQASEPGSEIDVLAKKEDTSVCVQVTDHGHGMDTETLRHLFEPFYTTRPVGSGRGLGLAVSWGVVTQHGGRIEVESAVGKGSTFRVRLPILHVV